jgi:hypothetical protein
MNYRSLSVALGKSQSEERRVCSRLFHAFHSVSFHAFKVKAFASLYSIFCVEERFQFQFFSFHFARARVDILRGKIILTELN